MVRWASRLLRTAWQPNLKLPSGARPRAGPSGLGLQRGDRDAAGATSLAPAPAAAPTATAGPRRRGQLHWGAAGSYFRPPFLQAPSVRPAA